MLETEMQGMSLGSSSHIEETRLWENYLIIFLFKRLEIIFILYSSYHSILLPLIPLLCSMYLVTEP